MMLLLRRKRMAKTFPWPSNMIILMTHPHVQIDILVIAIPSPINNGDLIRSAAVRIRGRGRVIDTSVAQAPARVVTTASEAGDAVGVEVGTETEISGIVTAVVAEVTTTTKVMRRIPIITLPTAPTDMRDRTYLVMNIIIARIAIKIMCTRQYLAMVGHLLQRQALAYQLAVHNHRHQLQHQLQLPLRTSIRPHLTPSMRLSGNTTSASESTSRKFTVINSISMNPPNIGRCIC